MANTYNEEAGASFPVGEIIARLVVIMVVMMSAIPIVVWIPYTVWTGSLWQDGGARVFIILWIVAVSVINRKLVKSDFLESSQLIDWLTRRFGVYGPLLILFAWELMMLVPLFASVIADRGYIQESFFWYAHLVGEVANAFS